ncbi:hypothetical protein C345_02561 [Cryptococcus neoformans A2-102-5]|nr:hypothetical protein C346_02690 [Cryptococcus neoformans var. grubii D17-1]OXG96476.1 hypothetical protein C345_02561 [Cryptococcus neoformans var. grubii A2-102-5]
MPSPATGPALPISTPLSRHSSLRSRPSRPSTRTGSPVTGPRGSSLRSKAVSAVSPSRLPATDSVSYFPPFEDMGSICSEGQGSSSGQSEREKASERDEEGDSAARASSHRKMGSLGSIAEFVSASISWGLTPFAYANTSQHSNYCHETSPPVPARPATSEEAVEALSRKFTLSKRRVLEPLSVCPQTEDMVVREKEKVIKGMHKRRMRSECEVETMVTAIGYKGLEGKDDDEAVVERLLDDAQLSKQQAFAFNRRPKPALQVPIPTLPIWRYPMPSPPVTSLCPDIPLEAFSIAVDNPCSPMTATSSEASSNFMTLEARTHLEDEGRAKMEVEQVDCLAELQLKRELQPSISLTERSSHRLFDPSQATPRKPQPPYLSCRVLGHEKCESNLLGETGELKRIRSGSSANSSDTIKPQKSSQLAVLHGPTSTITAVMIS